MSIKLKKVEKLPEIKRKTAGSEYDGIIDQFLENTEMRYAEISNPNVKVPSLAAGFKSRISKKYRDKLRVRIISGKCYLEKI